MLSVLVCVCLTCQCVRILITSLNTLIYLTVGIAKWEPPLSFHSFSALGIGACVCACKHLCVAYV